jgi:hypothetical protein
VLKAWKSGVITIETSVKSKMGGLTVFYDLLLQYACKLDLNRGGYMKTITNELGQQIGNSVKNYTPPTLPNFTKLKGTVV